MFINGYALKTIYALQILMLNHYMLMDIAMVLV